MGTPSSSTLSLASLRYYICTRTSAPGGSYSAIQSSPVVLFSSAGRERATCWPPFPPTLTHSTLSFDRKNSVFLFHYLIRLSTFNLSTLIATSDCISFYFTSSGESLSRQYRFHCILHVITCTKHLANDHRTIIISNWPFTGHLPLSNLK